MGCLIVQINGRWRTEVVVLSLRLRRSSIANLYQSQFYSSHLSVFTRQLQWWRLRSHLRFFPQVVLLSYKSQGGTNYEESQLEKRLMLYCLCNVIWLKWSNHIRNWEPTLSLLMREKSVIAEPIIFSNNYRSVAIAKWNILLVVKFCLDSN